MEESVEEGINELAAIDPGERSYGLRDRLHAPPARIEAHADDPQRARAESEQKDEHGARALTEQDDGLPDRVTGDRPERVGERDAQHRAHEARLRTEQPADDHHWHRGEHAGGRAKDGLYQEEHADVRHE